MNLNQLVSHCDELLELSLFQDYCPNGLQVEGRPEVKKIVTGVTASQALIDAAIEKSADVIIVHHGYFWKGEAQPLTGMKGRRIKSLMQNDVSLLAYHLPLDAHAKLGNNAQLANLLDFESEGGLDASSRPVGNIGSLVNAMSLADLAANIESKLVRTPLVIGDLAAQIDKIAWCTGAAQSMIEKAHAAGVDCFISGEISEPTVHLANELGLAYISAGHHATERYGVKALGEYLAERFDVEVEFVDIDCPV